MAKRYAALTGDIVKSSALTPDQLEGVRRAIEQAFEEVDKWRSGLVAAKPDFFRGDSWQMVLADPALALRVAMYVRASLKARNMPDTRIAIGVGEVESLDRKQASLSSGEAMMASGLALDDMGGNSRLMIALGRRHWDKMPWIRLVFLLLDSLIGRWTGKQATVVKTALWPRNQTHEEIARRLYPKAKAEEIKGIKRRSVTKSLRGADWHGVEEALLRFEVEPV